MPKLDALGISIPSLDALESAPLLLGLKTQQSGSKLSTLSSVIPAPPAHYAVINTLRGHAMVYVILQHTLKIIGQNQSWGEGLGFPLWLSCLLWPLGAQKSPGANGVAFFYVLSGLVAWLPHVESPGGLVRSLPTEGSGGLTSYWFRRGSRILPLYFVALLLFMNTQDYWAWAITDDNVAAGDAANSKSWWSDWALSVTLTSTFSPQHFYPASYGLLWAVGPIFWFSILFFPIWAILFKSDRSEPLQSAATGVGFAVIICSIVRVATKFPDMGLQVDETQGAISDSPLGRIDDFVVGMAASVVLRERIAPSRAVLIAFFGYLCVSVFSYAIANAIIQGFDYSTYKFTGSWWLFSALLPPLRSIGYSCCVCGIHHALQGPSLTLARFLLISNPITQGFGAASYSLYVWHDVALFSTFSGSPANNYTPLQPTAWRIFFVFAFMISPLVLLSYRYIEGGKFGPYPQSREDLISLTEKAK